MIETLDGAFVGDCGLTWQQVNGVPKLEVGYHVSSERQGRGYATEAAAASRGYARERADVTEIVAIIHPDNAAAEQVARKIGMERAADDHGSNATVRTVLSMQL